MRIATALSPVTLFSCSLVLGACGDDGSPMTPGTGSTGDASTRGESTSTPDPDSTAGPDQTTTDDPTGEMTTTGNPMTESETSSGMPLAFRFNSIELTDPGAGLFASCSDADQVNMLLEPALSSDEDGDGFLDMAFVLNFPELDQQDGAMGTLDFANAQCSEPDGGDCGLLPDTEIYAINYSVMGDGTCLEPTPENVMPGTGNAGSTMGPCFVTEPADAEVVTSAVSLPLSDARISAQFVGDPAGNLVSGTLEGYLTLQDAQNTFVEAFGMMLALDGLLCQEQMDGDGWWMHMNFTALPTEWNG